jgi:hypothetical protein
VVVAANPAVPQQINEMIRRSVRYCPFSALST